MVTNSSDGCRFDLLGLHYSDDERVVVLGVDGDVFRIKLKKLKGGPSIVPWVISSSDVREMFGKRYFEGLSTFIGRLAEKCHVMNVRLPLHPIDARAVEAAAEAGADSLNDLIKRTVEGAGDRVIEAPGYVEEPTSPPSSAAPQPGSAPRDSST